MSMRTIDIPPGHHIGLAAERLIQAAPARAMFNDLEIVAQPGDTADAIVRRYNQAHEERRSRAHANVPLPTLDAALAQDPVTVAARVVADTWALCRMASDAHRDGEATAWAIIHRSAQDALTRTRARVEGKVST
jgi:hypothetical protein